ncbi:MAG TPA: putative molybdenum carrier protein [Pyrinomonadaceae bacterium]|jgi:hypothetical protein
MPVRKIISGGQTGADPAALDFALENGIKTGGWIPKNRLAEDGRIPENYPNLRETKTENPAERTELNVQDSDATMIFSHGDLKGGSKLTVEMCDKHAKPRLHIDFEKTDFSQGVKKAQQFVIFSNCQTLNIGGARASEDSRIYEKTKDFLNQLFKTFNNLS